MGHGLRGIDYGSASGCAYRSITIAEGSEMIGATGYVRFNMQMVIDAQDLKGGENGRWDRKH